MIETIEPWPFKLSKLRFPEFFASFLPPQIVPLLRAYAMEDRYAIPTPDADGFSQNFFNLRLAGLLRCGFSRAAPAIP
jgi:hypothetical protein